MLRLNQDLISVIIPVYNAEDFLERCLLSVLSNSYKNIEVFLVDDGSTDSSPAICDEYAEKDKRINVIHKKNGGTAEARNTALKYAKGKYIAFADNDDFIHKDFYKIMHNAITATDSDVVVCELTRDMPIDEFNKEIDLTAEVVNKHNFILGTYCGDWTRNTAPWNKLYKRELFDNIKFPSGKGYEDAYTTYKLLYTADKITYVNAALYYWWNNKNSYSSKKSNPKKLFFREEAIREQAFYYNEPSYNDVRKAAIKFYIGQLLLMHYQLNNDFENSDDLNLCIKKMKSLIRKYYHKYFRLLDDKDSSIAFDLLHPYLNSLKNKILGNK